MRLLRSPATLWGAFILAHLWLGLLALYAPGMPLGDVTIVYRFWMDQGLVQGFWVGIDSVWVYPIVALVPMLLPMAFGSDQYASTWLTMIMLLNAAAFGFITGWGRSRERVSVGWWWIGFLVVLGPIAVARIDAVTVALGMVGVILIAQRPRAAAVVLAIATWIKVWPAVILAAAVIALRGRVVIAIAAGVSSAVVIGGALLWGSGSNVLSFVTEQTGRGLQVEAPISTVWLWRAAAGAPDTSVYYDMGILTYQVQGPGVDIAAAVITPALMVVVAVIVVLGMSASRRGVLAGDLFAPLTLALVTALIAVNKVGSPQFVSWLAVPIVLGLATSAAGRGVSFRTPGILVLVIAALTQLIYPYWYTALLNVEPVMLGILSVRNVLYFVLLGWAIRALVTVRPIDHETDDRTSWRPTTWPLASSVKE